MITTNEPLNVENNLSKNLPRKYLPDGGKNHAAMRKISPSVDKI
jgi:hypothetical protein